MHRQGVRVVPLPSEIAGDLLVSFVPGQIESSNLWLLICVLSSRQPQSQWLHSALLPFKPTNRQDASFFFFFSKAN